MSIWNYQNLLKSIATMGIFNYKLYLNNFFKRSHVTVVLGRKKKIKY